MIRAVLFDIGNVILAFSHERMCRQLAEVYGASTETIRQEIFESGLAELLDRGEVGTEDLWHRLNRVGSRQATFAEACVAATDIFDADPAVAEIVEDLHQEGVRLVVLSNTCEVHSSHVLREFPVFEYFDHLVLSHQLGAVKPEEKIFKRALGAAGCAAGECFYTDDIAQYVQSARSLGIDGEVFQGADLLREQLRQRGVSL